MMKKYLLLLVLCTSLQAEPVLLERAEYQDLSNAEKTVFTQHYDPQTQTLEILNRTEHNGQFFQNKKLLQYDSEGKDVLFFEEFHWDNTTQKWIKVVKGEHLNKDKKAIYLTYQGKNDEWVPDSQHEKQTDEKSETSIYYKFSADGKMQPDIKTYILFHPPKNDAVNEAVVETSEWDSINQQWRFSTKTEHYYDGNNEKTETRHFLGVSGKWVLDQKRIYRTEADGMKVTETFKQKNEQWQPEEREETRAGEDGQYVTLFFRWNAQQNAWEKRHRVEVKKESDTFSQWDEKTQQWQEIDGNYYTFDNNGRMSQQETFSQGKMGKESQRTLYQYDNAGNTIETLSQQFEAKGELWRDIEKKRYSYDLSLRAEDIEDKEDIDDKPTAVPMVNALTQIETYRMENNEFKLVEQVQFFYTKLPTGVKKDMKEPLSK